MILNRFLREQKTNLHSLKVQKTIFLINGENDIRIPIWMSRKVLGPLSSEVSGELMILKNAAHGGKEDSIMIDFNNFVNRVSGTIQYIV